MAPGWNSGEFRDIAFLTRWAVCLFILSKVCLAIVGVKGDCANLIDSPGKRLASFRKSLELSQRALAAQLGVSGGYIGQIEADHIAPSRLILETISERYNVSSDWLLNGHGEQLHAPMPGFAARKRGRIEPPDHGKPAHGDFAHEGEEFAMIDRYDLSVSAGTGLVAIEGADKDRLAFSRSWLLRNGINSDLAVLVRVKGDSMSPTITDGALVLIHLYEKALTREGVYAFNRDGASFIKRLVPAVAPNSDRPTAIVILADNPAYPPETLVGSQMNELRVIGRVRCAMVEF